MKIVVLPLVAIVFGALRVNSLECYQCVSQSLDDCLSQATQTTCYSGLNKCGTVRVKYESGGISSVAYVKGCMTDDICSGNYPEACTQEGHECNINCCSSDLCNGQREIEGGDGGEGSSAEALSCKKCISMTSMEDCSANEVDKQCPPNENRCGIFSAHREDMSYYRRDCIPEEYCETHCKDGFNEEGGYACELHCCQGDFCNASSNVIS